MLCESLKNLSANGTPLVEPLLEIYLASHIVSMLLLFAHGIPKSSLQLVRYCLMGVFAGRE